jgi:hypothetical protein
MVCSFFITHVPPGRKGAFKLLMQVKRASDFLGRTFQNTRKNYVRAFLIVCKSKAPCKFQKNLKTYSYMTNKSLNV